MTEVISAIRSFKFLDNEKHIAVALSGGADSMALLYGLYMLKEELGITVSALHLNHCLRGEEADRDEAFVRKECKKLGIPLTVKRVDIKAVAKKTGESIELAARNERYRFFEENKGDAVATAHNADDNLETVIYRLTRATGIDGLCGIPSRRDYFIRPLLCCQRKDIEKFLSENGVEYVTDSTNLSDDYTRNRIRHNVIPVLKELNESVYESFDTTVKILKDDSEYLNLISQEEFEKRFKNEKLCIDGFELLHNSIASRVIGKFLENTSESNNYCVNGILEIVRLKKGRFQIKGGKMVRITKGFLEIENDSFPSFNTTLIKESVEVIKKQGKINNLFLKNAIDCDKIDGEVSVRTKLAGDKITFAHRKVSKPLAKWMNEEGISTLEKESIPVIADEKGVIWVYGGGIDARVCPDENTKWIYRVSCEKLEGD